MFMARPRKKTAESAVAEVTLPESSTPTTPTLLRLPVCPVRGSVIYPTIMQHIEAGRAISVKALENANENERQVLIISQRDKDIDDPKAADLYEVGTLCTVLRFRKSADSSVQVLVQATARAKVTRLHFGPYIEAEVEVLSEEPGPEQEQQALKRELQSKFEGLLQAGKMVSAEAIQFIQTLENPAQLADNIAFHLEFKLEDRQSILEMPKITERLHKVLLLLDSELEVLEMQRRIQQQVKEEIDKNQREYFLREQMKAIQRELRGENEGDQRGAPRG
jgi:ATP-dependent Lon protease